MSLTGLKVTFNDYDNHVFGELLFRNLPGEKIKEIEEIFRSRSGIWVYGNYSIPGNEILSLEFKQEEFFNDF